MKAYLLYDTDKHIVGLFRFKYDAIKKAEHIREFLAFQYTPKIHDNPDLLEEIRIMNGNEFAFIIREMEIQK